MAPTRRAFLTAAASGLLGTAILGTSGCSRSSYLTPDGTLSLWYWNRSISDNLLAKTPAATGVKLVPQKIGGDYKSKFLTSLAGKAYIPDVVGLNDDVATYFPDADQFVDLYTLGAKDVQSEYLDWKWQRGVTPDGKMVGFPMDTGPTALFYRADLFEKAGLPTEPDEVAQHLATWEAYLEAGSTMRKATPDVALATSVNMIYDQATSQQAKLYMDTKNNFIGEGPQVRKPWDLAVDAYKRKITANAADFATTGTPACPPAGSRASSVRSGRARSSPTRRPAPPLASGGSAARRAAPATRAGPSSPSRRRAATRRRRSR